MGTIPSTVVMEGAEQVTAALDRLRSYRLMGEKQLRKIISEHVRTIRRHISEQAGANMKTDTRKAKQAVRSMIYKSMIGFNVNLFGKRRGGKAGGSVMVQMAGDHTGRGGNRRRRSPRTNAVDSYQGSDRDFILRWIETGTSDRRIPFTKNERRKADRWNKSPNTGNRGKITARPFFDRAAQTAITNEMASIREDIMTLINEVWEKTEP